MTIWGPGLIRYIQNCVITDHVIKRLWCINLCKVGYCKLFVNGVQISHIMRKPTFCICENKNVDQLCGKRQADQRLCFRFIDSTIPLLYKSEISSLLPSSVAVQPGLCWTWSETRTLVFS